MLSFTAMEGAREDVTQLLSSLRRIDSDKVTERKSAVAKLHQLLLSNELRRYIDQHSDGRISSDRNKITWDRLFNQVATLVLREVEYCIKPVTNRKSNASQQGSSKGTKMSKPHEAVEVLKMVIRTANRTNVKRLKLDQVTGHILKVLDNEDRPMMLQLLCTEYSNLLMKDVLMRPCVCLPPSMWHGLLRVYSSLIINAHTSYDMSLLYRIFGLLLTEAYTQCNLDWGGLYLFFSDVVKSLSNSKGAGLATKHIDQLLTTVNIFSTVSAINCRARLCLLGETLVTTLIQLLGNRTQPSKVKDQVIRCLYIQMLIHHPSGATSELNGAWANDWDIWKSNVHRLYNVMISDMEDGTNRISKSPKPEYITLATEVFYQVID